MATGDSPDMLTRLKSFVPGSWFNPLAPVRDAVFGGLADALSWIYGLIGTVKAQTRIATATGWFLDLIAWDFFGLSLLRMSGELDDAFRARMIAEMFRERVTRKGVTQALIDLTGRTPVIFEPFNPNDCGGGYGVGGIGYGVAGAYGSLSFPNQVFIKALRPAQTVIPTVGGYGAGGWGYGVGAGQYSSLSMVQGVVTDADIMETITNNVAAGVIAWVDITSK